MRNPLAHPVWLRERGDMTDHKQPTDHLPPATERDEGDERTTAGTPYPGGGAPDDAGGVSEDTAAEPDEPRVHGMEKPPRSQF
jgi:hypothetical protein